MPSWDGMMEIGSDNRGERETGSGIDLKLGLKLDKQYLLFLFSLNSYSL